MGYKYSSMFFVILGVLGVLGSFSLFCLNVRTKKILDGNSRQKKLTAIQMANYLSDGVQLNIFGEDRLGSQ